MNGIGERCGNANLVSILPVAAAEDGLQCVSDEQLASLTRDRALRRRAVQHHARPEPALRRPQRVRPQGRDARRRRARRRPHVRAPRSRASSATSRELLVSELSGKGTVLARAEEAGIELDAEARHARGRAAQGARAPRLPLRGRRRLLRAACCASEAGDYEPLFRLESFRVITEKREDGKVETEATIKIWVDGERYVRTAEGNGPVNALDRALRDAIAELLSAAARHRARQLQGAHHRRAQGHRRRHPRPDRRLRRRRAPGARSASPRTSSRRSWEALVDSLEYAMQAPQSLAGAGRRSRSAASRRR